MKPVRLTLVLLLLVLVCGPLAAQTQKAPTAQDLFRDLWQQVGGAEAQPIQEINICTICLLAYNNCIARCTGPNSGPCMAQCSAQFTQCTPCDCSGGVPHC